jgi:hypothetical protein
VFVGSLQGNGRLASFKGAWTGTYVAVASSGVTFFGEGQIIVMSGHKRGFTVKGFGLERIPDSRRAVNKLDQARFHFTLLKSELGREDFRLLATESHLGRCLGPDSRIPAT